MTEQSTKLSLPYIASSQAQKHITHNEAVKKLDTLVQMSVLDQDIASPPAINSEGDSYIIASLASGAWAGEENNIAIWQDGAWEILGPNIGWICWIIDENTLVVWNGTIWAAASVSVNVNPVSLVGVNATADLTNRLSINSPASLFNHEGTDHHLKVNKAASLNTASLLFQSGFSGRAEMGLTGDDDFHFKVSGDGVTWNEAISINSASGEVEFPFTSFPGGSAANLLLNGAYNINQRQFSGGALPSGNYGFDRWKSDAGGCTHNLSAGVLTLTSGTLIQIVETPELAGQSVTLSIDNLTGGALNVDIEGVTGTISAGAGRHGVSLIMPGGSIGDITVKLTPAAGAVSFGQVQLEKGSVFSSIAQRPLSIEELLCQRYCLVLNPATALGAGNGFMPNTLTARVLVPTAVQMRALPSVSINASNSRIYQNNIAKGVSAISSLGMMANGITLDCTITSAGTQFASTALILLSGGTLTLDAEL